MSNKSLNKDTAATQRKFRAKLGTQVPYQNLNLDPNYEYRWVVTTYDNEMTGHDRIDYFIDRGWDVVYSEDRPEDERSFAPDNSTKNSERTKPVTKREKRHSKVLMKCLKEQRKANESGKADRDLAEFKRSQKSLKRKGNEVIGESPDIDLSRPETTNNGE